MYKAGIFVGELIKGPNICEAELNITSVFRGHLWVEEVMQRGLVPQNSYIILIKPCSLSTSQIVIRIHIIKGPIIVKSR